MKNYSLTSTYLISPRVGYKSSGVGCSANLYGVFSERPGLIGCYLTDNYSHTEEFYHEIARWNTQAAEWCLRAELNWPEMSKPLIKIWDINAVVAWLIYPIDGVWQIDEFDGTSKRTSSFELALQIIADL